MKPEIALAGKSPYQDEEIQSQYQKWLEAYAMIATEHPSVKGLAEKLTERIKSAYKLYLERSIPNSSLISNFCGNDSYMEEQNRKDKAEYASLDGDFPLGKEDDMAFALEFFSVKELAMIQLGYSDQIVPDRIPETKDMREGFLKEIKGLLMDAREAYQSYYARNRFTNTDVEPADQRRDYLDAKMYLIRKYEELLAYSEEPDLCEGDLNSIGHDLCYSFSYHRERAEAAKDEELMRKYEQKMAECYQRALERNYRKITEYKKRGVIDFSETDTWTLTLDQHGKPVKTSVIGIGIYGSPILADNCKEIPFAWRRSNIKKDCADLGDLIPYNDNLYELLEKALRLKKQGPLGAEPDLTPNYDLSGLVGGQLDAAAWQNYAIEHGLVHRVNLNASLDRLIASLQYLIELYEKALSMV